MNPYPLVSIIIPNFNGDQYIEKCLQNVLEVDYPAFEVIVVDDGSTDSSVNLIKEKFSNETKLKIIQNERNMGAAVSRNIGAKAAKGSLFVFLDNDVEIERGWLKKLVIVLLSDRKIAVSTPKIFDCRTGHLFIGHKINMISTMVVGIHYIKTHNSTNIIDVPMVGANCLLIRKEAFQKLRGFDEDFTIPYEDSDLCLRVKDLGYRVVCASEVTALHRATSSKTSQGGHAQRTYNIVRNRMVFARKHANPMGFLIFATFLLPIYITYYLLASLQFRKVDVLKNIFNGILDGFKHSNASPKRNLLNL